MTIRLMDMPDRIGKLSAVTRLIDPRSFSSTISPLISKVACLVVMAEASAEIRLVAREMIEPSSTLISAALNRGFVGHPLSKAVIDRRRSHDVRGEHRRSGRGHHRHEHLGRGRHFYDDDHPRKGARPGSPEKA